VRFFLLFILFFTTINALNFTVASYNVENLFDLNNDGTEYKEYKPYSKYWNQKNLDIKLNNIAKVLSDVDADIIALQEIESQKALDLLLNKLPIYKYSKFLKNPSSSIGVAVLSKFPILKTKAIRIDNFDKYARPILEATFKIQNSKFKIFNNHWSSKRAGENKRVRYAVALKNHIYNLNKDDDYILIGDFNSNYDEWITFKSDKKLNNTYGITGINHILNTVLNNKYILENDILKKQKQVHYNLWFELEKKQRFSVIFRKERNTPDNILVSSGLFNNLGISYLDNSFKVFKPKYLYLNNHIIRWGKTKGYSDHLPIVATFTTNKFIKKETNNKQNFKNSLDHLYKVQYLNKPLNIKKIIVIYKYKKSAILKEINGRSIYAYKCANSLRLGNAYNLTIDDIELYNGLLEVKQISNIKKLKTINNYKQFYKDGTKVDIFDTKYTNDIVTNLKGIYKKRYLHLTNGKKIRLFLPKKFKKIQDSSHITIKSGHLTVYKGQVQIAIHKQSDIMLND